MEIKELVSRNSPQYYSTDEMIFLVTEYIKEKKGVFVDINLFKGLNPNIRVQFQYYAKDQLFKLDKAFNIAFGYFKNK